MVKTAVGIAKEEGVHKLWQGVYAGLMRHVLYSGTRIVTYKALKQNVFHKTNHDYFPIWMSALCTLIF
jgi:solute carrier family 25 (mitochondrial uncoupling protein), member 27